MRWAFQLTVWLMSCATLLVRWMLLLARLDSAVSSRAPIVHILSSNGSIVPTSPVDTGSQLPPLEVVLTSTGKLSITWLLLVNTNPTWASRGSTGEENGEDNPIQCTLNFQVRQPGPQNEAKGS